MESSRLPLAAARRARGTAAIFAAALAAIAGFAAPARADGWTLPEDTGHFEFKTIGKAAPENGAPGAAAASEEKFGFKPAIEYGLTDHLTLGLQNESQLVKSGLAGEQGAQTDGVMNTQLFLRGRLLDGDWYKISMQDIVSLPVEGGEAGFGRVESRAGLEYGRSGRLAGGTWTSSIRNGFAPSLDAAPDTWQTDLTFGWRPVRQWQFTAQSFNTLAFDSDGDEGAADGGDSAKGRLSLVRYFGRSLSLQLAGWQTASDDDSVESGGFDAIMWLRY